MVGIYQPEVQADKGSLTFRESKEKEKRMDRPDLEVMRDKETAINFVNAALEESNEQLLEKIYYLAHDRHDAKDSTTRISNTLAPFSALLINLARQADQSTKKVIDLTRHLVYLTYAIVTLTIVLVFFEVAPVIKKHLNPYKNPNNKAQTYQHTDNTKKPNIVQPVGQK